MHALSKLLQKLYVPYPALAISQLISMVGGWGIKQGIHLIKIAIGWKNVKTNALKWVLYKKPSKDLKTRIEWWTPAKTPDFDKVPCKALTFVFTLDHFQLSHT